MTSRDDVPTVLASPSTRRWVGWAARRSGGSPTRRNVMINMMLVLALGAAVGWWLAGGPDQQGVTRVSGEPDCPGLVSPAWPRREGLAENLVPIMPKFPVGPVGVTVCRYPGMNSRAVRVIHGAVLDEARTAEVAGWLNTERDLSRSSDACRGRDDGSRIALTFRYLQGPPAQVIIRTSGCPASTNGVRREVISRDIVARIADFVPAA